MYFEGMEFVLRSGVVPLENVESSRAEKIMRPRRGGRRFSEIRGRAFPNVQNPENRPI